MKLDTFINRPVLSTVISIFIVLLGLIGLVSLPITQYPDLAPPTISVTTTYQGANAQAVLNSVIAPLEESINGAEGMTYMESTATNTGSATINVYFKQGFDPDMAAVDVQNRVAKAQSLLPAEVTRVGVLTQKRQTSMLVGVTLYDASGKYSEEFVENYMKINIVPQMQRIQGVGDVMVMGADYSMRIWLKPDVMALYHLEPTDISAALAEQNIEAAPGAFGEQGNQSFQYTMRYKGRLVTPEEFGDIVIRATDNGEVLRLKDVATVELGRVTYGFHGGLNGKTGVTAIVFQTAGSNATKIINDCLDFVDNVKKDLPAGLEIAIPMNNNDFLYASIHHVIQTLIEAFVLVFIVVFLFLQDIRSTIIPAIAIPVALIGTFFGMSLIGFSVNLITLSALVLAIAIVVDDAIVVVEAVHAKLDVGYKSARKASIDAMNEIGGAIVSITLVMMLVFIPVSFMPGTAGVFYQQFGITMAIAIGLSALNALTLSPALCAVFLKPHSGDSTLKERMGQAYSAAGEVYKKRFSLSMPPLVTFILLCATITFMVLGWFNFDNVLLSLGCCAVAVLTLIGLFGMRFREAFNVTFARALAKYKKGTEFFIRHKITSFCIVGATIAILVVLMRITPSTLVPNEDTGTIFVMVDMPPGTSQERTGAVLTQVDSIMAKIPAIQTRTQINGYSFIAGQGATYGTFIIKLKDWSERSSAESSDAIIKQLYGLTGQLIKDGRVVIFAPPMITGYSATNGFEIKMQDKTGGDINEFFNVVQTFLGALNQQPEIMTAYTTFNPTFPQYLVDVDAAKCKQAGISPQAVLTTLQGYYGGMYVSNFNRFGKLYRVMMQASPEARVSPETLNNIKMRNGAEMASVANFVKLTRVYAPDLLNRFNMFQSISVNGNPAQGYSSGDALAAIERVAAETLPQGYGYEYAGMTREEANSSSNATAIIFGLCLLFVYLLLSAQYESYILPLAVILSIPFGLMGTFIFADVALFSGMAMITNNIYLQIALIMLIGLLAKNAILIVEFALERRRTGMSIVKAAIDGATARLRPILMTSLALIIGLLPLMFAHGVGANGNRALGTGSVGGMLIGMIFQIFIVPALFVAFQIIQEKITPLKWQDTDNEGIENEIEQYTK